MATIFRTALLAWWDHGHRPLPWRESNDFYRVWISEIMLQQTRVEAVRPYYDGFLARFPGLADLAAAAESDVLHAWSGLGYYSRARNLQRAAQQMIAVGVPATYREVLSLPGVGPYTAAAVSSIVLGLRHAAVDGNVVRVIARLRNDSSPVNSPEMIQEIARSAQELLDPLRPGDFNQAMMELGAMVCTPRNPACLVCPVSLLCAGKAAGTQNLLPVKPRKPEVRKVAVDLIVLEQRAGKIFLTQRGDAESRMPGFWEIPERSLFAELAADRRGSFTHQIVNDRMRITVWHARVDELPPQSRGRWFSRAELTGIPLTTVSRKVFGRFFREKID